MVSKRVACAGLVADSCPFESFVVWTATRKTPVLSRICSIWTSVSEASGSGCRRLLLTSISAFGYSATSFSFRFEMEAYAASTLLLPGPLSLACYCICPVAVDLLWWVPLQVPLWLIFKTGPGQEHSSRLVRINLKPAPKRLHVPPQVCLIQPSDICGDLPAWSICDDLAWLRAAIITTCTNIATQECEKNGLY